MLKLWHPPCIQSSSPNLLGSTTSPEGISGTPRIPSGGTTTKKLHLVFNVKNLMWGRRRCPTPDNRPRPQHCAQKQHSRYRCCLQPLPALPAPADKGGQREPSRRCGQEERLGLPHRHSRRCRNDVPKPADPNCPEGICYCNFMLSRLTLESHLSVYV